MRDFMMAAVPLVVAGIALAVFFAGRAEKKKKQEKKNGYEAMGMCFGAAVGTIFPEYIGVTLSMGMLVGLLVGMCVKKL